MVSDTPPAERRLGEVVRRQLDRTAHRRAEDRRIDSAREALGAFLPDDVDQAVQGRGIVVLGTDGVEGRVGLHAGLDEEQRVSEDGCPRIQTRGQIKVRQQRPNQSA